MSTKTLNQILTGLEKGSVCYVKNIHADLFYKCEISRVNHAFWLVRADNTDDLHALQDHSGFSAYEEISEEEYFAGILPELEAESELLQSGITKLQKQFEHIQELKKAAQLKAGIGS